MLPNFIIIGAHKSASTFVQRCLSEHPDVFIPSSEVAFFEDPDYLQSTLEAFEKSLDAGRHKKAIGIKRPSYLHKSECPERIHRHLPTVKLIAILRDPVERAVSAYYHSMRMGFAPLKHVNIGLMEIIENKQAEQYKRGREIIEFGFYGQHLLRYFSYFSRDQMLIMLYNEVARHTQVSFKNIFDFLEIDSDYIPQSLHAHPQAGIYSIPRLRLLTLQNRIIYTYSRDQKRLFTKAELGEKVSFPGSIMVKIIKLIDRRILSRMFVNTKPRLNQELVAALSNIYKEDTLKLAELLNQDLSHWRVFHGADLN